jgi:hypothetical protein
MQPHPAFPKVKPVDSWATSWGNVMGIVAGPGSTPDPVSSHENIRGGAFAPAQPLSPEGTTDLFRPFRALYFSPRTKPRTTHWPSLARPVGRRYIRKIRNPL